MAVNLEGKHLLGPDRTGTTVLPACIIQTSPLLYFTLPSSSHEKRAQTRGQGGWGGLGESRELDKGGEKHWNKTET